MAPVTLKRNGHLSKITLGLDINYSRIAAALSDIGLCK